MSLISQSRDQAQQQEHSDSAEELRIRKQVSFASEATEYLISTKLSPKERSATWYHPMSFSEFKKRNRALGKAVRQRRTLFDEYTGSSRLDPLTAEEYESDMDADVTRGIEHFCCAVYFDERKKNKQTTVQAVMSEQRRQRSAGCGAVLDQEAISEVARSCTHQQRETALMFGRLDEKALSDELQKEYVHKCAVAIANIERPMSPRSVARFDDIVDVNDDVSKSVLPPRPVAPKNAATKSFNFSTATSFGALSSFFR
jgi:hypothetical protein